MFVGGIYPRSMCYDDLVPAVREALERCFAGWEEYVREETSTGRTVFKFDHIEFGNDVGEVRVRRIDASLSELSVRGPKELPSRQMTQEEIDALKAIPDKEDRLQRQLDLYRKIDDERERLHRRRQQHCGDIIKAMFARLRADGAVRGDWQAQALLRTLTEEAADKRRVGAPPIEERSDADETGGGEVSEQATTAEDEEGRMGIFFAYAREDETLRDELEKHLSMLKREGVITSWHDRKIGAGKEWEGEIDTHLNTARVILLLISSDFVDSDYCWDVEVKRAMERHAAGEAPVIPIILRPVDWKSAPFGKLQALPTDAKPVTTWINQDEAFLDIARGIRAAVMELRAEDNDSNPNHETHNP